MCFCIFSWGGPKNGREEVNPQNKIYPNKQVRMVAGSRRHYEKRKRNNKCLSCGKDRDLVDKNYCAACRDRSTAVYKNRVALGMCGRCGLHPLKTKTRCAVCIAHTTKRCRLLKRQIIEAYGGKCACCGDDTFEFLTIEHTWGGGNAQKKKIKRFGNEFYRWLVQHDFPKDLGLAILCMNCNFSKGKYGYCPHEVDLDNPPKL